MKQTYQLFRYSQQTEKVEWLVQQFRPLQTRNSLADSGTTINIYYMEQCPMKKIQKQELIRLFQLLAYLKTLNGYKIANLKSKFRLYKFPVIDFFNSLEHNLVLKFLSDKDYRMLITIPEAYVTKVQNQWMREV